MAEDDEESVAPVHSVRTRSREQLADYLLDIGATLASYGCPSYRLEDVIRAVAEAEGYRAEPFALPTGLFLRVVPKRDPGSSTGAVPELVPEVHRMTRLSEWGTDLERLTLVDEIFNDVVERRATIEQARLRIRAVTSRPPYWPPVLVWAASTAASAAAAVFFGGGVFDIAVSAVVGASIAGVRVLVDRDRKKKLLHDFLGGLLAAVCAWLATRVWPEVRPEVIVLAGPIALFPGMTFTTGLAEIAEKNLVAGTARLMESVVTLLLILFGVALVAAFDRMGSGPVVPPMVGPPLGVAWQAAALAVSSVSFAVLFQVPRRFLWAALLSGATGYLVTALALHHLPDHVAAFCAALSVCVLANGLARVTNRPAQLFQLPGMMLLVPGSFGFTSLGAFLQKEALAGAEKAFTMALVGAALVIGVLVANVLLPPRKLL